MPSLWGKLSSKDAKKKTKENFIDTLHRFISPIAQKENTKSGAVGRRNREARSEKGSLSRAESRSTSPTNQVSRCQSFADRPLSQPLPLPGLHPRITRASSEVSTSKPKLEKRGKPPQLLLPLSTPSHIPKRPATMDVDGNLAIASVSSNCSFDSDDPADSQLQSPIGNDIENGHRDKTITNNRSSVVRKDQFVAVTQKNLRETVKPTNTFLSNQKVSTSPKKGLFDNQRSNIQNPQQASLGSAPDSSISSPSRSPKRILDQIQMSAFWAVKPCADVTFLGSGQCSSPGSGQTSGHNSVGGDMLSQLFWQTSRGSAECSPIPSPRMTSPGPSSRIHSGTVSPLHPRAGGTAPESPTSRCDEGKKHTHQLMLPPIRITKSPFPPNNSASNGPLSMPRSPGKADNTAGPGSRWKKGKLIGRGTFGHVYVGFDSESGEMCAMKEVTLFSDDAKSKESAKQLEQEISLLSCLRHPNIVQYYGSDMIDDRLYIYLEYVSGGSIHKLLQEYGQFGEPAIRSYTQQILSGLAYLHAKNTVHRDIKGANILVDPNGRVKLADFGMAKHITGQSCPLSSKGSPYWMAPEVIKNTNGCNLAVDIWSLGCTVLEMATSKPPWSQYEGIAAMFKIGNSKELPAIPDHLSEKGKDFVRQCLQREPSRRPTAADLLQHPFVKNGASLERSIVFSDPSETPDGRTRGVISKGAGRSRNISSLGMEGLTIQQRRGAKLVALPSEVHIHNISCPVSPTQSPLQKSRSPQHANGRMSPSPISSPRTTSAASTPPTGGNGAIPFNHLIHSAYHKEGVTSSSRLQNDLYPSGITFRDPTLDLFLGLQQGSPVLWEKMSSEAEILCPQYGMIGYGRVWNSSDRQPLSDRASHQVLRDHMLNQSLDTNPNSPTRGRKHST
ncbi:mitogen-activated protein kinase kinase kinase YODA-like [Typha latifolia]|uniref:mitogen-activated protein kinase kinase kinase YODA-like n=1 Tax=Typha latifolia TaxID=4733 RepID=UPI003C2E74BD